MNESKSTTIVIGFDDDNRAAGIPRNDQIHTAIFGEVGSGKSTVNTIMINQNINRDEGFLVLDPHGSLAQDVIRMIPESEKERLVYISLDSVRRWGRTVKINPLEVKDAKERYVVVMNLVSALKNIYRDSWGPQLEMILRNAANALVEIEGSTLRDMVKIITDPRMRSVYLNRVANPDVRHFWDTLYEQYYQKDAGRAAYNKLDKILATPQVAAMLDTSKSTLDFADVMESGKWVVIDLSSGGSDDVVSFVGTILINMAYVEAKKRFGADQANRNPFFMYIDEAHLFAPFALRELLNTMRKANVKVAITSQTLNTFPREFAREVSALVRTIICFKVDTETASMFKTVMPVEVDILTSLSHGRFAFYSQGNPPVSGLLRVFPIVDRGRDWITLASYSAKRYGEPTSLEKYITQTRSDGDFPSVSPLEGIILLLLYNEKRDMARDEICDFVQKMFDVQRREVSEKLDNTLVNQLGVVERRNAIQGDGDANRVTRYVLSRLAYESFFSQAAAGRRAGSDLHLATIFMIMKAQLQNFKFCIPDLGDSNRQRPDLLIFEPERIPNSQNGMQYDPYRWSDKAVAVEVETDPTKHASQIVTNFQKNFQLGYEVWFVAFSEKHGQYLIDTMEKNGIGRHLYKITVMSQESVERLSNLSGDSVTHLTIEELEVYNALGNGRTPRSIAERIGLSTYDVMAMLWKLEKKGMAERGYAETKSGTDAQSGSAIEAKRVEYFAPTEQGRKLEEPMGQRPMQPEGTEIKLVVKLGAQKEDASTGKGAASDSSSPCQVTIDLNTMATWQLKAFAGIPELTCLTSRILEKRGYNVTIRGKEVSLEKLY
ncbi:MAG: DUF87 domain-containing protein [Thaumarchaeota archaeon]|nr:DUF87 domain-containing protein [Nitrososphaerota archaeon]